jgi:hypothetical protein
MHAMTIIAVIIVLLGETAPGGFAMLRTAGIASWVFIWGAWAVRGSIRSTVCRILGQPSWKLGSWGAWIVVPLLFIAMRLTIASELPMRAAFSVSRPAMERVVKGLTPSPIPVPVANRVGVYRLRIYKMPDGSARCRVAGSGFMDSYGFAYLPNGVPRWNGKFTYRHIKGPWYAYREYF